MSALGIINHGSTTMKHH